jgi:hypothetical protein
LDSESDRNVHFEWLHARGAFTRSDLLGIPQLVASGLYGLVRRRHTKPLVTLQAVKARVDRRAASSSYMKFRTAPRS